MRPILANVDAERDRQEARWGEQNHHPFAWLTILAEEFGEAARAALEGNMADYHKELVQVAAVACAACESIERNHTLQGGDDITRLQRENAELRAEVERLKPNVKHEGQA